MKTFCYFACILALLAMPSVALAAGPGPYNLLVAIDETSVKATADPHIFSLHDARGRAGEVGTLTGTGDLLVEIGATNTITNPSFESDLSGWSVYIAGSSVMSKSTVSYVGVYGVEVLASAKYRGLQSSAYFSSGSGTCSAWVKSDGATSISVRTPDGVTQLGITAFTGDGTWKRVSVGFTTSTSGNHIVRVLDGRSSGFSPIYVDGVQCERSQPATSFTSYRIPEHATVDSTAIANARAVEFWYRPNFSSTSTPGAFRYLLNAGNSLLIYTVEDEFVLDNLSSSSTVNYTFNQGDLLHIVARWDNAFTMTVNGVSHTAGTGYDVDLSGVYLCSETATVSQCEGELSAVRFYRSLTDDQVTWLYNNGAGRSLAEVENMVAVVEGETGTFMVDPTVSYGQAGNIITGLLSGGLVLFLIVLQVVAWFRQ